MKPQLYLPKDAAAFTYRRKSQRIAVSEDAMNILRLEMYNIHPADLAAQVGVSVSCINAIRSGRTKWPRPNTFFLLLERFQLELLIRKRTSP